MADGPLPNRLRETLESHVHLFPWSARPGADYAEVEGVFSYGHLTVDDCMLDTLPNVRIVSNHGVGVDHIDVAACQRRGVLVGNTPSVLDDTVADTAFTVLLAAARRVPESLRVAADPHTTEFDQTKLHGQDVHHATLGIVGLGRIGQRIAQRAQGFEMSVLYHQRRRNTAAESQLDAKYVDFDQLLAEADFLVLTVPLTDKTRGLIGSEQFARMKPSAVLVNVARGPVVVTDALVDALRNNQLWAAALDVTDPEPLPRDHPLLKMDNVVVTSHIGSASIQTRQKMVDLAVENLFNGLAGKDVLFQP